MMVNLGRWRCFLFGALSIIFVLAYLINVGQVCCKNGISQGSDGDNCVICKSQAEARLVLENREPKEIIQTEVQAYISQFLEHDSANASQIKYFDNKAFQEIQAICPFHACDDDPCVPVTLKVAILYHYDIYFTGIQIKIKIKNVLNFIF